MKFKKKKIIIYIILILIIILLFFFMVVFSNDNNFSVTFNKRVQTLNNFQTNALRRGWVQVQGTNIDLPVLSSTDYISSNENFKYAWLSGNYVSSENRKVIIGHNVLNVSNKPIQDMTNLEDFEGLMAFVYYDFAKENFYIQYTDFKTQEENLYLIYAIGFYDYGYDRGESFSNINETEKYIEKVRKNSIYNYDIDVVGTDEIITIKTCTRFFGANEKQQFVIDARKIRKDEKIGKYDIEKSKNYQNLNF